MDTVHPYCLFRNHNQRMVILRCVGPEHFFHEKVIFPFSCPASSDVQIWSHGNGGTELVETFPASDLLVHEQKSLEVTAAMNLDSEESDDQLGLAIAG
jgi:hypothetical protein